MIISELNKIKAVKFGDVDIKKVYSEKYKVFPEEDGYFYICHSSTGLIERFPVGNSVDWPTLVTTNHTYGGLYSDWAGKGDYAKAIEAGTLDDSLFVDNKLQDTNYVAYDGSVVNTKNRFAGANSYTSIQIPIKNKIYYVCEPLKEYFENIHVEGIFNTDNSLDNLYFIGTIDTTLYKEIDYTFKAEGIDEKVRANIASKWNFIDSSTGESKTIAPKDVNSSLARGYVFVTYTKPTTINAWYQVNASIVTRDDYTINHNKTIYIYSGQLTKDTIIVQDYPPTT